MESAGILILEFCLLCFIGVLYWAAKKELTASAARQQTATLKEIRQVEETIQALLDVLETKASEIESRLSSFSAYETDARRSEQITPAERPLMIQTDRSSQKAEPAAEDLPEPKSEDFVAASRAALSPVASVVHSQDNEVVGGSFADALRLVDGGGDPRSVARTTGLTIAEIETAIRMRQLRGEGAEATDRTNTQEITS